MSREDSEFEDVAAIRQYFEGGIELRQTTRFPFTVTGTHLAARAACRETPARTAVRCCHRECAFRRCGRVRRV